MCPLQCTRKSLFLSPYSPSPSVSVIKEADKKDNNYWEPSNLQGGGGKSSVQGGGLPASQKYTLHKWVGVYVAMHMDSNCAKNKIDMCIIFTSNKLK